MLQRDVLVKVGHHLSTARLSTGQCLLQSWCSSGSDPLPILRRSQKREALLIALSLLYKNWLWVLVLVLHEYRLTMLWKHNQGYEIGFRRQCSLCGSPLRVRRTRLAGHVPHQARPWLRHCIHGSSRYRLWSPQLHLSGSSTVVIKEWACIQVQPILWSYQIAYSIGLLR